MMTEDDIPAEILRLLPEVRKTHPGITRLEAELARVKASVKELWMRYQVEAGRIQIRAASIQRRIRLEETYLKQRIAEDLRVAAGLKVSGRRRRAIINTTTNHETQSPP